MYFHLNFFRHRQNLLSSSLLTKAFIYTIYSLQTHHQHHHPRLYSKMNPSRETPCRLANAQKRIKELEKENAVLQSELSSLRARSNKEPQSAVSSTVNGPRSKKESSYAQPTVSSRCRDKSSVRTCDEEQEQSSRVFTIGDAQCTYKSGVPTVLANITKWPGPMFLRSTSASGTRGMETKIERSKREKEREELKERRMCKPKSPLERPSEETLVDATRYYEMVQEVAGESSEPVHIPPPYTPTYVLLEADPIAIKSRLDEDLSFDIIVYTDTAKSFDYLFQAVEICQELVYEMGNIEGSGWPTWPDGPHTVGFGRGEIEEWTRKRNFSVGKYDRAIYGALQNLIGLRNTISHPDGDRLGRSDIVDELLGNAQRFCVILGRESAAAKVRQFRDALLVDANQSWQDLVDLCELIEAPFHDELKFHPQHGKLFKHMFWSQKRDELEDPRIWDLGLIWADQNGVKPPISPPRDQTATTIE